MILVQTVVEFTFDDVDFMRPAGAIGLCNGKWCAVYSRPT